MNFREMKTVELIQLYFEIRKELRIREAIGEIQ